MTNIISRALTSCCCNPTNDGNALFDEAEISIGNKTHNFKYIPSDSKSSNRSAQSDSSIVRQSVQDAIDNKFSGNIQLTEKSLASNSNALPADSPSDTHIKSTESKANAEPSSLLSGHKLIQSESAGLEEQTYTQQLSEEGISTSQRTNDGLPVFNDSDVEYSHENLTLELPTHRKALPKLTEMNSAAMEVPALQTKINLPASEFSPRESSLSSPAVADLMEKTLTPLPQASDSNLSTPVIGSPLARSQSMIESGRSPTEDSPLVRSQSAPGELTPAEFSDDKAELARSLSSASTQASLSELNLTNKETGEKKTNTHLHLTSDNIAHLIGAAAGISVGIATIVRAIKGSKDTSDTDNQDTTATVDLDNAHAEQLEAFANELQNNAQSLAEAAGQAAYNQVYNQETAEAFTHPALQQTNITDSGSMSNGQLRTPVTEKIEANATEAQQAVAEKASSKINNAVTKLNDMAAQQRQEAVTLSKQATAVSNNPTADYVTGAIGLLIGTTAAVKYAFNMRHNHAHKQSLQDLMSTSGMFSPDTAVTTKA